MKELLKEKKIFTLNGKLLSLKTFTHNNITDEYIEWLNDPDVVKYSNQRFLKHTRESCTKYLESFEGSSNLFLSINLNENNCYVGTMTIYISIEHQVADIGILIGDKKTWGLGIASEAYQLVFNFLFKNYTIRKVTSGTLSSNKAMLRVFEKLDMHPDGIRFKHEIVDHVATDILFFQYTNKYKT